MANKLVTKRRNPNIDSHNCKQLKEEKSSIHPKGILHSCPISFVLYLSFNSITKDFPSRTLIDY